MDQPSSPASPHSVVPASSQPARVSHRLFAFVVATVAIGAAVIAQSIHGVGAAPVDGYFALLAVLTFASGRITINIPGSPGTVSVSEVFVFATILMFGPAAATLLVAIDGLATSLLQKARRLDRTVFNVAEPSISTWCAGHAFIAVAGAAGHLAGTAAAVLGALAMAATFFILNSGLTAIVIGLDAGTSPYEIWRRHARYLAANYYAAASIAALAVGDGGAVDVAVVTLVVPLLIVSYLAYREASNRVDEAQHHVTEVGRLYQAATDMLAIAVDTKDQLTHGHIRRVQRQTVALARALGVTDPAELKAIEAGALLHDIGKLAVPDHVLNKPSGLTRSEFESIKKHPALGARILMAVDFPYPVVPIVRHHHEQWDGRGYPDGLAATQIPLGARIIGVVDCYDALTSDRPYRTGLTVDRAIELLRERKGTYYDPAVVDAFIRLLPAFETDEADHDLPVAVRSRTNGTLARSSLDRVPRHEPAPGSAAVTPRTRALIDDRTTRLAGVETCLFAFSADRDVLVVVHATPGLRQFVEGLHLPTGAGVSGWVAANRSTIGHAESALDLGDLALHTGLPRCTSTPVFVDGEAFGALTVYHPTDQDVTSVVGTLAQEVGLAIAGRAPLDEVSRMLLTAVPVDRLGRAN